MKFRNVSSQSNVSRSEHELLVDVRRVQLTFSIKDLELCEGGNVVFATQL